MEGMKGTIRERLIMRSIKSIQVELENVVENYTEGLLSYREAHARWSDLLDMRLNTMKIDFMKDIANDFLGKKVYK